MSMEQTKWALSFLVQSRKRARDLVDDTMTHTMAHDGALQQPPRGTAPSGVPSDTRELVSTCLCLMSVVRRGSTGAIPPLVAQKLMERLLELLEPRHEANMDLYAELRSAAEGVHTALQSASMG